MTDQQIPSPERTPAPVNRYAIVLFCAAVLLFGVLVYTVREIVNPFVIMAACVLILYPMRRERYARRLLWAAVLFTGAWVVYDVSAILVPFLIAFLFAYLFDPLVTKLSARFPRWVITLAVVLALIGVFVTIGMFLIPLAFSQVYQLLHSVVSLAQQIAGWYEQGGLSDVLRRVNLPEDKIKSFLGDQLAPRVQLVLESVFGAVLQFLTSVSFVLGQVVNIVLMPFLGFYLLKDFPAIRAGAKRVLVAFNAPPAIITSIGDIDGIVNAYARGQLIVGCITGALAAGIFTIGGVPYAILLGLMIAVLDVVPYVGLLANIAISVLVVELSGEPSLWMGIYAVGVLLGLNILEVNVIAPRIIGKRVGLPPVLLILSIFIFAHEFGIIGVLIAVPVSAVVAYIIRVWLDARVKRSAGNA